MKKVSIILGLVAVGLIIFNITKLDFDNLFQGESTIVFIEIIAALIAIVILAIFNISKRIEKKIG
ncbi:MAG: hypothetical protein HRT69_00695 [Flavobacteriaceae bacterium]|nr:hypothetical protein [Flavobacteriaceae bacterium]